MRMRVEVERSNWVSYLKNKSRNIKSITETRIENCRKDKTMKTGSIR